MSGRVEAIFIAGNEGEPMQQVSRIYAITGLGLQGDRYALQRGAFQKPGSEEKIRHVTLIEAEAIAAANAELEQPFPWTETRRNIVVSGISLNCLVSINRRLQIGNIVTVRVCELCDPCKRPGKLANKSGFDQAFANRGGVRAEILVGGVIEVGFWVG